MAHKTLNIVALIFGLTVSLMAQHTLPAVGSAATGWGGAISSPVWPSGPALGALLSRPRNCQGGIPRPSRGGRVAPT